ncbi:MAG: HNH endonuclease [Synechococcus sp.]
MKNDIDFENLSIQELYQAASRIGNKRYHRLTTKDLEDYRQYEKWRYICGQSECGTTRESQEWVRRHSSHYCPVCDLAYQRSRGRSIDHKLPRAKYPWLSLNFDNFWVICRHCNREKGEMDWLEYEHFIFTEREHLYPLIRSQRPSILLRNLAT